MVDWERFGKGVSALYKHLHLASLPVTTEQRLLKIRDSFLSMISFVLKKDKDELNAYRVKAAPYRAELGKIQERVKREIESMLHIQGISLRVYPASSYTAGTNLIEESDLDFNISIDGLNEDKLIRLSTACGSKGYTFDGIKSEDNRGKHYVFQQETKGIRLVKTVEVEVKLRYGEFYEQVHKRMHEHLDGTALSQEQKATITWIKLNLKRLKNQAHYKEFKALYYEHALAQAGAYEMIYPLTA
jgi:hypothetical protein